MDIKETKINSWLETPINREYTNKDICLLYVLDLIEIIESKSYAIKNKNEFRDDIIEYIYNLSHEQGNI